MDAMTVCKAITPHAQVPFQRNANQGYRYMSNVRNGLDPSMVPQCLMNPMVAMPFDLSGMYVPPGDGQQPGPMPISALASALASASPERQREEREYALRSFKSGTTPILVATDVAARDLDIPHVSLVVNFDLPNDIDDYVHRTGRTGRAGKSGLATAFFNENNSNIARSLAELLQESNQEVPDWLSRYAARASYGGGKNRCSGGGGRFGGRDFRRDAPSRGGGGSDYYGGSNNYSGNSYSGYGGSSGGYGGGGYGAGAGVASAWE